VVVRYADRFEAWKIFTVLRGGRLLQCLSSSHRLVYRRRGQRIPL